MAKTKRVGKSQKKVAGVPYFDPSEVCKEDKIADQPVVRAIFSKECRLHDGTFTKPGQEMHVPLGVAHAFASHILPEPK